MKHFFDTLQDLVDYVLTELNRFVSMDLTESIQQKMDAETKCYLCGGEFDEKSLTLRKVIDHNHLTGEIRGE